jgi:hypothetical protein
VLRAEGPEETRRVGKLRLRGVEGAVGDKRFDGEEGGDKKKEVDNGRGVTLH